MERRIKFVGGLVMDPITALLNFAAALFNYLSTPVGQKVAGDWHVRLERIWTLIDKVWDRIVDKVSTPPTQPPNK